MKSYLTLLHRMALLFSLFLPFSCVREEASGPEDANPQTLTCTLQAQPVGIDTRSDAITNDSKQGNIFIAVYHGGKKIFAGEAPLTVTLVGTHRYNMYAWTSGALGRNSAPELESALIGWEATYPGLQTAAGDDGGAALSAFVHSYGIPMAGCIYDVIPETTVFAGASEINIPLQRLFARLRVRIHYDPSMTALLPQRSFLRLRACNWAYACHPFDSYSFDRTKVKSGAALDISTEAEADGSYLVYVPENLQGIRNEGDPARCTYLEAALTFGDADANGPGGAGGGIGSGIYRFYPKAQEEDEHSFNIHRNAHYDIDLNLSYDGRFITGQWYSAGDTQERRSLQFDENLCQALSPPGSVCYSTLGYSYNGSDDCLESYFNRFNGIAVGTESEVEAWVESGTIPSSTSIRRVGRLLCNSCGTSWWGYPESSSSRISWARSVLSTGAGNFLFCPACHSALIAGNTAAQNQFINGGSGATAYQIELPAPRIAYQVPANAQIGQAIRLYAATRDGRLSCIHSFTVGDNSVLLFNESVTGTQYVAQQCDFAPVNVPADISSLSYSVTAGSDCVELVSLPGTPLGRRIRFKKAGDVSIQVRDQNGTLRQTLIRSILLPSLGFLATDSDTPATEYSLHPNGTAITPRPVYLKADGSLYTDYDASLYASCLGDPALSEDGAWTECASGKVYINRIQDSTFGEIPYRSGSLGNLRASSPGQSGIAAASVPLKCINPFSGWPTTPLSYTINYAWNESLKKGTSLPCYFNAQMELMPYISPMLRLYSHTIRGIGGLSYSEQEARAATPCAPTVNKYPGHTSYCGRIHNSRSGENLEQVLFYLTVNVEMRLKLGFTLENETATQQTWRIDLVSRHSVSPQAQAEDLGKVFPTTGRSLIYPSGSRVSSGGKVLWYRARYNYNAPGGSYYLILDLESASGTGARATADTAFFKNSNSPQFTRPYLQSDGYSYIRPGEEPLSAPASDGVWQFQLEPLAW